MQVQELQRLAAGGSLQALVDVGENLIQAYADAANCGDDRDRDQGGDQAVFDRRRAVFVVQELI